MKTILYLHGFISSPASRKAVMLGDFLRGQAPEIEYRVPSLHHRPAEAISQVLRLCLGEDPAGLLLVGSSLGGFYATVAAERSGCRAVVINPAVHPQAHFGRYLGAQQNLYTGERFELTREHVAELAALDPPAVTRPDRYWLMVETADEVLDYREAISYYAGAFHTVVQGGDHSFASFPEFVPDIAAWARESGAAAPPKAAS
ncbi:MAG TPA: YqiA/YcfP family alpha/beta fold hydrolase [Usitatibacteraceae bacterium]|nr:YqiA/YcfP family alpha/beta fold hydrolase [Usitatibacteraceae bacterium]